MPYFDQRKRKWKGVVKRGSERYTHLFKTKAEAKCWEVEKWKEIENPKPIVETGIDFLTACNEYLDYSELRFSLTTYGEK